MPFKTSQIPLRLNPHDIYRLDNFYFNQPELKYALLNLNAQSGFDFIYLWGQGATGKSHLLIATATQHKKKALYLPLADIVNTASPDILQSVSGLDLLCVDDLQQIIGKEEWEEALFHCFNQLHHTSCQLLVAARQNPASIGLTLPDLASRMATALVYQLNDLNDEAKQHALMMQASIRGMDLADNAALYLLRHYSRDMSALMAILHRLDKASMTLSPKRRLTQSFIREVLADIDSQRDD